MKQLLPLSIARTTTALLIAAVVLGLELVSAVLFLNGSDLLASCLHAGTCASLAAIAIRRGPETTSATAIVQLTAMMLPFLGPFAAASGVMLLLAAVVRPRSTADAAKWHEHLFPNLAADELSDKADAIVRHRTEAESQAEIESFFDVLRWGTLAQKEHVLSLVSRSFKPEFAPVLRAGLAVDDIALRAQAAAGLSLLETRTSSHLGEMKEAHRRLNTPSSALQLALALSDASYSGLYDPTRTEEMRLDLIEVLTPLVQSGAAVPPNTAATLGRALVHVGQLDRAVATLEPDEHDVTSLSWLLEALYRKGDFSRLNSVVTARAEAVRRLLHGDGPLSPALHFWTAETR